jgi:hypothetical protein
MLKIEILYVLYSQIKELELRKDMPYKIYTHLG